MRCLVSPLISSEIGGFSDSSAGYIYVHKKEKKARHVFAILLFLVDEKGYHLEVSVRYSAFLIPSRYIIGIGVENSNHNDFFCQVNVLSLCLPLSQYSPHKQNEDSNGVVPS